MEQTATSRETPEVTRGLAQKAAAMRFDDLPQPVVAVAKQCLLDWLGVTIAAVDEPLVRMLRDHVADEGGNPQATLVGRGGKVAGSQAALVNGAAGHALDFDDVLGAMNGHPTAPVAPAVLALAEKRGLGGKAVLTAFAAGVETEARIGRTLALGHYARGFHNTATLGSFAAAAGCANLLKLDPEHTAMAFGIAGTQAAGIKSMFGTMCKPLHAGKAAFHGYLAATQAARGFSSRPDVIECFQGFAFTMADGFEPEKAMADPETWYLPDTLFKYHPACYGTHAPIEAARKIASNPAFSLDNLEKAEVLVDPKCLAMCNIPDPVTGLEGKFSLRYNIALGLSGGATGALDRYEDEAVQAKPIVQLRQRVRVQGTEGISGHQAEVLAYMKDGLVLRERYDVGVPERDLAVQWNKLATKFRALASPLIGASRADEVVGIIERLENEFERRSPDAGLRLLIPQRHLPHRTLKGAASGQGTVRLDPAVAIAAVDVPIPDEWR